MVKFNKERNVYMEVQVIKGSMEHIDDCEKALINSELGKRYFSKQRKARVTLEEGFRNNDIYVAVDHNNNFKGFIWIKLNGLFHKFPYIHMLAVKRGNRNQGIGKILLRFVEEMYLEDYSKIFLVVSDFNEDAKRLYMDIGYSIIGNIPNLYIEGITECLMMKSKVEQSK